jgi:hypothetical protein
MHKPIRHPGPRWHHDSANVTPRPGYTYRANRASNATGRGKRSRQAMRDLRDA